MLADDEKTGHNMNLEYAHVYLDLLNDTDKALQYAQKEYQKRPNNIDVNRMIARIYTSANDKEMANKYMIAAASTKSKHPELKALSI